MKPIRHILILALATVTTLASAQETNSTEQLTQMVGQLQKSPTDRALREKIIKLALELQPAPVVPEEANRAFVRGGVFHKEAKTTADFEQAIAAYRDALRVAPWWGVAYNNMAVSQEAAGKFDEAIASLKLSISALPVGSAEAREAQNHIYAIEAKSEIVSKQAAITAQADAAKKAETDKIASAAEEKQKAEQARRDVITQIKKAVGDRRYNSFTPSYSSESRHMWEGVNQDELFGGGRYFMFGNYDYYIYFWKFYDDRAELWVTSNNGSERMEVKGESGGSSLSDMRWFWGGHPQSWGYFNLQNGNLYVASPLSNPRPLTDSGFDSNRRYGYSCYSPSK